MYSKFNSTYKEALNNINNDNFIINTIVDSIILSKNSDYSNPFSLAKAMEDYYNERTAYHINSVIKFSKLIKSKFSNEEWTKNLVENAMRHDSDKVENLEFKAHYMPYVVFKYGPKELSNNFTLKQSYINDWRKKWVVDHFKRSLHHPEAWDPAYNPFCKNIIVPTKMDKVSLAEMCADWMAVGEEKGNTAKQWFEQTNNVRWKWEPWQSKFILKILNAIEMPSVKPISFPAEEIATISIQSKIITTRVSDDFKKFKLNDIVISPWDKLFKITNRIEINDIKDHPFYNELTKEQKSFLSKFDKIAVLELTEFSSNDGLKDKPDVLNSIKVGDILYHGSCIKFDKIIPQFQELDYNDNVISLTPSLRIASLYSAPLLKAGTGEYKNIVYSCKEYFETNSLNFDKACDSITVFNNIPNYNKQRTVTGYIYKIIVTDEILKNLIKNPKADDVNFYDKVEVGCRIPIIPTSVISHTCTLIEKYKKDMFIESGDAVKVSTNSSKDNFKFINELCKSLNSYESNIIDYRKQPPTPSNAKTDEERIEFYRLQDPKDTLKWKCGFCWDITLCAITLLKNRGISAYAIYAEQEDGTTFPNNHCTVVFNDKNGFNLFEASWSKYHGVHGPFKSENEICKLISSWMSGDDASENALPINCYRIQNYPESGCTANEFMTKCRNGQLIGKFYGNE